MKKLFVLCVLGLLVGCTAVSPTPATFDRHQMLSDITTQVILPQHEALVVALGELDTAVKQFTADPNPTTLSQAQAAWQTANLTYLHTTPFNIGPVQDSLLHNRLDKRPPRTDFVEEVIAGEERIDSALLASFGSTSVGMGVLEYLLFAPDGAEDNTAVLTRYTTAPHADRRAAYLQALSTNAHEQSQALLALWQTPPHNYAEAFVSADMDGGDLQGSTNMLVNQLVSELETMVRARLGAPLGKTTGSEPRPELLESEYAQVTRERLLATLAALRAAYCGGDGLGLDDYLDFLGATYAEGEPLTAVIEARFVAAQTALEAIDEPLTTAVYNQPDQVEAAYQSLRDLLVLFKADLPNQLGVTLTFNDNDGD